MVGCDKSDIHVVNCSRDLTIFFEQIGENWRTKLHSLQLHSTNDWKIATLVEASTLARTSLQFDVVITVVRRIN